MKASRFLGMQFAGPARNSNIFARTAVWLFLLAAMAAAMLFIDVPAARWVQGHTFSPAVRNALRFVRLPGHYGFTAALALALVWPFRRHWRAAAWLMVAGAGASGVTAALKWCFGRIRPFKGREAFDWRPFPCSPFDGVALRNLSFPSGDATLAFATAAVVAAIFPRYRTSAFAWAVAVAVTRVLQGAHYPSDTIASAIVGIAFAQLTMKVLAPKRTLGGL